MELYSTFAAKSAVSEKKRLEGFGWVLEHLEGGCFCLLKNFERCKKYIFTQYVYI